MKNLLRLEEVALFAFAIFLYSREPYPWWLFPLVLLLPDLGMLGYARSPKIGAIVYNIVHHRALSIVVLIVGYSLESHPLILIGVITFAHSTLDRIFDYGLKYSDNFKHTHLSSEPSAGTES
ncbi:MAG: DUF4260 domain-containing protein [bacterium]|nr:DUF4260 domain-containing protein [bacterium]